MFDIGWSELLIIAVVAIIVVGPKDLPRLLRSLGQIARKVRETANEFRGHIDDVIRDAELDDIKSAVDDVRAMNPVNQIKKVIIDEVDNVRDIVEDEGVRNYHKDFPDDGPHEDFDDPGAEWTDEDDAYYSDAQPEAPPGEKTSENASHVKTANSRSDHDKGGTGAARSDDADIAVAKKGAPTKPIPRPRDKKQSTVKSASADATSNPASDGRATSGR